MGRRGNKCLHHTPGGHGRLLIVSNGTIVHRSVDQARKGSRCVLGKGVMIKVNFYLVKF